MFEKLILSELFIIKEKLNKLSLIDINLIKNHILHNISVNNKIKEDLYWYKQEFFLINYHQHILWLQEYIMDHYASEYPKTLVINSKDSIKALVQNKNESIILHNTIDEYDLKNSSDVDCIYTVSTGKKNSYIIFEYEDGRNKHKRFKVPLEENNIILFPSSINRYITKNENDETLINLFLHFQYI
jgi:hypothetical protein